MRCKLHRLGKLSNRLVSFIERPRLPQQATSLAAIAMQPLVVPGHEHVHDASYLPESQIRTSSDTEIDPVDDQIHELARRVTSISVAGGGSAILPKPTDDVLDPNSPEFDSRKWVRAFYGTQRQAFDGRPPNSAGLAFKGLKVFGEKAEAEYQKTVEELVYGPVEICRRLFGSKKQQRVDILQDLEGVMESGEMLCVLGPPGSGCSTLLKTIAGETYGFQVSDSSTINYQGLGQADIKTAFKGEAIYTAEVDYHFPKLTVGETLYFAARARCPQKLADVKHEYAEHLRDVVMAMLGISHTKNTRVGDDFIRGVSGGERKRVSIAEAILSYSPWQCWDNSTRGLDSANAVEFCRTLRLQSETFGSSVCVAIYQAPQEAYDVSPVWKGANSYSYQFQPILIFASSCSTKSLFFMKGGRSSSAGPQRPRHTSKAWASSAQSSRRHLTS